MKLAIAILVAVLLSGCVSSHTRPRHEVRTHVVIGMSGNRVVALYGWPSNTQKTVVRGNTYHVLTFRSASAVVYLTNGRVTRVSTW